MKLKLNVNFDALQSNADDDMNIYDVLPRYMVPDIYIAISKKGDEKSVLHVPGNKEFLAANVPYFKGKFKPGGPWGVGKELTKKGIVLVREIWEDPEIYAFYLKSLYYNELKVTKKNCIKLYYLLDYLCVNRLILETVRDHTLIELLDEPSGAKDVRDFYARAKYFNYMGELGKKISQLDFRRFKKLLKKMQPKGQDYVGLMSIWLSKNVVPRQDLRDYVLSFDYTGFDDYDDLNVLFDTLLGRIDPKDHQEIYRHIMKPFDYAVNEKLSNKNVCKFRELCLKAKSSEDDLAKIKFLLDYDEDVKMRIKQKDKINGAELVTASLNENIPLIELICEAGGNVDIVEHTDAQATYNCMEFNEVYRFPDKVYGPAGSNHGGANVTGYTPSRIAAENGKIESLKCLLEHDKSKVIKIEDLFVYACVTENNENTVKFLFDKCKERKLNYDVKDVFMVQPENYTIKDYVLPKMRDYCENLHKKNLKRKLTE